MDSVNIQAVVEQQLAVVEQPLAAVEEQVDTELDRLSKLDDDDLSAIRQKRMDEMKKIQEQKREWELAGHGEYTELSNEKEFFDACKRSLRVVCHLYSDAFFRCKIVDKHFALLAPKHMETKFVKMNADKAPFVTKRLNIRVLPTIVLILDGITIDYIRGFADLGNTDEFTTEILEARLAKSQLVTGVETKPIAGKITKTTIKPKTTSTIRDGGKKTNKEESDEDDW